MCQHWQWSVWFFTTFDTVKFFHVFQNISRGSQLYHQAGRKKGFRKFPYKTCLTFNPLWHRFYTNPIRFANIGNDLCDFWQLSTPSNFSILFRILVESPNYITKEAARRGSVNFPIKLVLHLTHFEIGSIPIQCDVPTLARISAIFDNFWHRQIFSYFSEY